MLRAFRIQDVEGRGPFKPGFSRYWADEDFAPGLAPLPAVHEEFPGFQRLIARDEHVGTAVRELSDLRKWFSAAEMRKLAALGYSIVSVKVDRIIAESANQMVIANRRPLNRGCIVHPWP